MVRQSMASASLDVSAPRPCLRGHHQRCRGPSLTRTASGDSRGQPQRSRYAAIASLTAPLVGPADIATAAPSSSLLRGAPASAATASVVVIGPRPKWPAATLGAGQRARVMRRLPVLRRPWSALLASPWPGRHGWAATAGPPRPATTSAVAVGPRPKQFAEMLEVRSRHENYAN